MISVRIGMTRRWEGTQRGTGERVEGREREEENEGEMRWSGSSIRSRWLNVGS